MSVKWTLESDVNDWVKDQLKAIKLKKHVDWNEESSMSDYLKESLKGSAKTKRKTNFGKPDFHIEKYKIPVIFEDKVKLNKLIAKNKDGIKMDDTSIANFAVNGGLYYAQSMISSEKYHEVVVVGVAGDSEDNVEVDTYFVFSDQIEPKHLTEYKTLDFLQSEESFDDFYKNVTVTEEEKHQILINTKEQLAKHAKNLNKLMNNNAINVEQRVVYVSGMLLSMQDIYKNDKFLQRGLVPDDLIGAQTDSKRDGSQVYEQIEEFLRARGIPDDKLKIMLGQFKNVIQLDDGRDELIELDKNVSKLITESKASITKQIFVYIFENIFKSIDGTSSLDIMGEMYSEFLKYALGDGKEIGIVLTPPYITKMMAEILDVNKDSKVMDLATGSAGFLIASMERMISDANNSFGKKTENAANKIEDIKRNQLLGVELDSKMYTLAATNMILRGDGSANIQKGSSFDRPESLYTNFGADRLLLNPPFSYDENGMPFIAYGLDHMESGYAAIIIQDSAGSGKASKTNKHILKSNTLLASIKMPTDTFMPSAGVQTSIYVFEAGKPHDYDNTVRFIDFRNDGYKRTKRGITEIDHPLERYQDIIKIYKAGKNAKLCEHSELWNLEDIVLDDQIDINGNDWNFEQHQVIDTTPTEEDFMKTVGDYLSWEVSQLLKAGE
ncbi:N-6 DNA methylase [Weissella coleopterorum]|uniref:site-specific DNA-methyltransferase (adenine-specific) n=1 Tax=Weissella coleopterorum TaxID=2714949 RepID=A0A6G8AZI9_9LACO|nr:N-6 DNA methylase [Weissella coleopterorum]QIL50511.1 N-6 DNA methylase [Weissella coleopterorum]